MNFTYTESSDTNLERLGGFDCHGSFSQLAFKEVWGSVNNVSSCKV